MENLIVKYCRKNYTKEDLEKVKEIFGKEEIDSRVTDLMQMQWYLTEDAATGSPDHFDAVLGQIHQSIGTVKAPAPVMRRFFIGFSRVAAILIIPLCIALFFWLQHKNVRGELEAQTLVTAPRGTIKQVALPDGTQVWLNSGSSLSYNKSFNDKMRKVILMGEAYFEVTKNPERPFVVHGNELSVKVLGTKFDVRSYSEDSKVNVTLMEGSVRLEDSQSDASVGLLQPDQVVTLNKQSGKVAVKKVDARNANEWMRGTLLFDDEEMDQIAHSLEREYNVLIRFQDNNIKRLRFYGRFKKTQSLDEILNIVVSRQGFHYQRRGDTIVFISNQ